MPRLQSSFVSSALLLLLLVGGLVPLGRSVGSDADVVIAVIDTGVDRDHPDLRGRLEPGYDFVDEDREPDDGHGHGTQMAGLALSASGADGRPLCASCRILPLRIGRGSIVMQATVARAISHAVEQQADVILVAAAGVRGSRALTDAVAAAEAAGIPIVAPAGQGFLTQAWAPASDDRVVSVVALDSAGALHFTSNTTGFEDIAAVADLLPAPVPRGGSAPISGSSAAAARVAGVAGALRAIDPEISGAQLRRILAASASPLGSGRIDRPLRYGVLNPDRAIELLRGAQPVSVGLGDLAVHRVGGGTSGRLVVSGDVVNAGRLDVPGLALGVSLAGGASGTAELATLPALGSERLEVELPVAPGEQSVTVTLSRGAEELDRREIVVTVPERTASRLPVAVGPPSVTWSGRSAATSYDATIFNPDAADRAARVQVVVDDSVVSDETRTVPGGGELVVPVRWESGPLTDAMDLSLEVRVTPADGARGAGDAGAAADERTTRRWRVVRLSPDTLSMHLQYAQPNTTLHVVADAPWMTTRDYVPIMVYVPLRPEGPGSRVTITGIDITRDGPGLPFEPEANRILFDTCDDPGISERRDIPSNLADWLRANASLGAGLIGPLGDPVELTGTACDVREAHWHVIYRIPWAWLGGLSPYRYAAVSVGVRQVMAGAYDAGPADDSGIAHISSATVTNPTVVQTTYRKVLRFRKSDGLPRFDERDHYYDGHVHMYSEHTVDRGTLAPLKNFGGPLAMLIESSYALGLVDRPLAPNGFGAYKDQLVLTNHNAFYSGPPYDAGTVPYYGPMRGASLQNLPTGPLTAAFPGSEEFKWHRTTFGRFAGEEVDLASRDIGADDQVASQQFLRLGHHFLVYNSEHFEGPWHGGNVTAALKLLSPVGGTATDLLLGDVDNPNPLDDVLTRIHDRNEDGFGYAAHPESGMFLWPEHYFDLAIGREETGHNSNKRDYVRHEHGDFVFKGSQVWNAKTELAAKYTPDQLRRQSPFSGRWGPTFARSDAWEEELETSLDAYRDRLTWGLSYSFAESPEYVFIRKNYMVAGTDAHGDFNYGEDVLTTNFVGYADEVGWVSAGGEEMLTPTLGSNAYGRVRTYVLAHDGEGVYGSVASGSTTGRQQDAYRRGQSVLTDGPICQWWLDSSGRHNPDAGVQRWHDAEEKFENVEGLIGGSGAFDGGRTLLTTNQQNNAVFARTRWMRSESPYPGDIERFVYDRVNKERANTGSLAAGPAGALQESKLPDAFNDWARGAEALILHGEAPVRVLNPDIDNSFEGSERCIANPIWVIPTAIEIEAPESCPIMPGELKATFYFPNTIGSSAGVFVQPLDRTGVSERPESQLAPQPGWKLWPADHGLVRNGKYTAVNEEAIACPSGPWDAASHAPATDRFSYVLYMKNPTDVHGVPLNDIGDTFVVEPPGTIVDSVPPRLPPPEDSIPPATDSLPPAIEDSVPPDVPDGDTGWLDGFDFDPDIFNDPVLEDGPRLPGMQRFVMELPTLRLAPSAGTGGGSGSNGGSGPSGPAAAGSGWPGEMDGMPGTDGARPPEPRLYVSGLGASTGEAFQVWAANLGDTPLEIPAGAIVVEPVDLDDDARSELEGQFSRIAGADPGSAVQRTLDGYCLDLALGVPPTGTAFRVASRELQERFAPMRGILDAARELYERGGLNPDSDPEGYFHSIRQWAIWTRIEELDQAGYEEAFIERTRENFEAAGRDWSDEIEQAVRGVIPNRWNDIQAVLERVP